MIQLPPEMLSCIVKEIRLACGPPDEDRERPRKGYFSQLRKLRLVCREFAESQVINEILFRRIKLAVSRRFIAHLEATHRTIAPYVRAISIETSFFNSLFSKRSHFIALLDRVHSISESVDRAALEHTFEEYHALAVEDEPVEDELFDVWLPCLASFRSLEIIEIARSWHCRSGYSLPWYCDGPGVGESKQFDLLGLVQWLQRRERLPDLQEIHEFADQRILRLVARLLRITELQLRSLTFWGYVEKSRFPDTIPPNLSALKIPELCYNQNSRNGLLTIHEQRVSQAIVSRTQLFKECLEASRTSLQQLRFSGAMSGVDLNQMDDIGLERYEYLFTPGMCLAQLQTLILDQPHIQGTRLTSAIRFNLPNLEWIVVHMTQLDQVYDDGTEDEDESSGFWPEFLGGIKEAVGGRRFRVSGSFYGESDLFVNSFTTTLNVPYDRAFKAFSNKSCVRYEGLSTAIRLYIEGHISWKSLRSTREEIEGDWPNDCDDWWLEYEEAEEELKWSKSTCVASIVPWE